MKNITPEQLEQMCEDEGKGIQQSMYSWFLTRESRGTLLVKVQNPVTTNAVLSKEGITIDNLDNYIPSDLARILGVDAVIMGTFQTSKPMSEGAAIALSALFGFFGSTNQAVINLFIYNGEDGETMVNYHRKISGSIGVSSDDLVNKLMRKASRKIAYTK